MALRKSSGENRRRIVAAVESLANDPRPSGARKLLGYDDVYRIRVSPYRVLYSVVDRRLVVIVLKLGHRREIYR